MKTNTIQAITVTVAIGLIAAFAGMKVTGNILTGAAIGVSYLVVAALVAMTASDYRSASKAYSAAPPVAGQFPKVTPVSVARRTPSVKDRLAA